MWQVLVYPTHGFDEVQTIAGVFFNACGNGENICIKNNIVRIEADLVHQNVVTAFADVDFLLVGVGLASFIKRHHHGGRAIAFDFFGVGDEFGFAFFERNRVHNRLALYAFQAFFNHIPARAVHHDGHTRNVRLRCDQIQEAHHRGFGIEHAFVHVDVDDLCAVFHLGFGHFQGFVVLTIQNQTRKCFGACHVGALTHVDKQAVDIGIERL